MERKRVAVFASGSGSNAENIVRSFRANPCWPEVALIVCNRADAGVVERARRLGVECRVMRREEINDSDVMGVLFDEYAIEGIALAGFLLMIPGFMLERFRGRVINIHPSLLPRYGGRGMYGRHVHEAVVAAGESETGITVHLVSDECDGGEILFQASVPVEPADSPADVEAKVHRLEYIHYPRILAEVLG